MSSAGDGLAFGIIYPISDKFFTRIVEDKRTVFVKYQTHWKQKTRLGPSTKVLFYVTKGGKSLVGEATISRVAISPRPKS